MADQEMMIDETELHDEDVMEEGHDPKNAEAQSVASVDQAGDATGQAPARKGDKRNSDPMPKTKAGMINAMYGKMKKMNKASLTASYGKMMGEEVEAEEAQVVAEQPEVQFNYTDELSALVESEATLSEEFKERTAVIFEAAVKAKLSEEIDRLEENYATELAEETTAMKSDLVEKVDSYLNYVVEQWMEDNKLAIQSGLRTEIAEGFMNKLKDVFEESYIAVPEEKVDLVDDLAEQVEELEAALNERTEEAMAIAEKLEDAMRKAVIREAAKDLAETQVEKLAKLAEGIEFEDEATFADKVAIIKETHFKPEAVESTIAEETEEEAQDATEVSSMMETYLSAIRKQSK